MVQNAMFLSYIFTLHLNLILIWDFFIFVTGQTAKTNRSRQVELEGFREALIAQLTAKK